MGVNKHKSIYKHIHTHACIYNAHVQLFMFAEDKLHEIGHKGEKIKRKMIFSHSNETQKQKAHKTERQRRTIHHILLKCITTK